MNTRETETKGNSSVNASFFSSRAAVKARQPQSHRLTLMWFLVSWSFDLKVSCERFGFMINVTVREIIKMKVQHLGTLNKIQFCEILCRVGKRATLSQRSVEITALSGD